MIEYFFEIKLSKDKFSINAKFSVQITIFAITLVRIFFQNHKHLASDPIQGMRV